MVLEILKINSKIRHESPEYERGVNLVDSFITGLYKNGLYPHSISDTGSDSTIPEIQPYVEDTDLVPAVQLAKELHMSRTKMAELLKNPGITVYSSPADKRKKLISRSDMKKLISPGREEIR